MNDLQTAATYDEWAPVAACAAAVIFLIGYSVLAKWWRHPEGQAVASLDVCLVIALTPSVLHQLFGLSVLHLWYAWYYGSSIYLVALITLWRLAVVASIQRQAAGPRRRRTTLPEQKQTDDEVPSNSD
jgi:hypothetical protein